MIIPKDQDILNKINISTLKDNEIIHEKDNIPSAFENLTLDELLYLREKQNLLNILK